MKLFYNLYVTEAYILSVICNTLSYFIYSCLSFNYDLYSVLTKFYLLWMAIARDVK